MARLPDKSPDELVSPPLDAPSNRWLRRVGIGVIVVTAVGTVVAVFTASEWRRRGGTDQIVEVNNLRQIGIALFEFEHEYGKLPDETTIDAVKKNTDSDLLLGTKTSNDFFRQLIASGIAYSESIFYAKIPECRKPDNKMDGIHALEKGEVGFTWFVGARQNDGPNRPLVVAPMIPGTDRFDPKPFNGKALILKLDNSVASLPIDKNGHAVLNGRNMMDPHHPVWNGHAPIIAWPDL